MPIPLLLLILLPALVHLPALICGYSYDPINLVSGLTEGTWQTNGMLRGYPWLDANAGVTTEALGGLAAHDWLAGVLPWWNPYSGVGMPLAAEGQTPAFFLPFVLLLALPHGLLALRMALMALSGLFTFMLLRRMPMATLPAFAGAVLFELNGTFGWLSHGPIMPIAFLPLTLLGLEQARAGTFPFAVAAGVAWSFLAGFPETAVLNMLLAAAWGGLRLWQSDDRAGYAWRCGAAAAAGLLIAAPAIWPFLEALPRGFIGEHARAAGGGFAAANPAQALFPTLLGNPLASAAPPPPVAAAWSRAGGYVPVAVFALAVAALRRRGPDVALRWVLAGFAVVTGARACGFAPAVALFNVVPLLRLAAVHTYIWPAWSMAAAVMTAFTLEDWRAGRRPGTGAAVIVAGVVCVVALAVAAPAARWMWLNPPPFHHPLRTMAGGVFVAAIPLLLLRGAPGRWRQVVAAGLPCGQAAALCAFWPMAGPHGRTIDVGALRFLQAHLGEGRVVSFGPLVPNYGALFGIAEIGHNALPVPTAWVAASRDQLQPGSNGIVLYEGDLPSAETLQRVVPGYEAMGARYALVWPGEDFAARFSGTQLAYAGRAVAVWTLPTPAPYAEAPGCTVSMASRLAFSADCAAPSRLLRRELFDPGWTAAVHGAPAAVAADGIFQAVTLPAGHSLVRFAYAPPGIGAAWLACAAGLALLLGVKKAVLF